MLDQITTILSRSRKALIEDVLGTAAIFSALVVALHLPLF